MIRYRDIVIVPTLDALDDSDPDILFNALTTPRHVDPSYLNLMNTNYLHYLIKRGSTFTPQFRAFFFQHLLLSCPFVHSQEFADYVGSRANARLRLLYDEVLQQRGNLTLKQRCRLRIKQTIHQYPVDVRKLSSLPASLQSYLSFDLFHPNFVQMTLAKLNQVQGRVKPSFFDELQFHEHNFELVNGHFDWEDQIPDEMDEDEDELEPVRVSFHWRIIVSRVARHSRMITMITTTKMPIYSTKKNSTRTITTTTRKKNGDLSSRSSLFVVGIWFQREVCCFGWFSIERYVQYKWIFDTVPGRDLISAASLPRGERRSLALSIIDSGQIYSTDLPGCPSFQSLFVRSSRY